MKIAFHPRRARGFSVTELLVAVGIGLLLLAGLTTLFVRNTRAQGEIEKANRQIENGRYAIDVLTTDLRNAGYYGEFDPSKLNPTAMPAICAASVADLAGGLKFAVQGSGSADTSLTCITEAMQDNTDVLVVRRTGTCLVGQPGCTAVTDGGPFFQASLCNNDSQLGSSDPNNAYRLDTDTSKLDRRMRNCTVAPNTGALAPLRRYLTHIYFIAKNNQAGDGIPTLKRAELVANGNTLGWNIVPLAEGIENLQVDYGMDVPNPGSDGVADTWTAAPAGVASWQQVVAVKLALLARNPNATLGYKDTKTYKLGSVQIAAQNDGYKRHVFQTTVALPNPAGRRAPQ
jgi:type IV pilus assembly protein PilW